MLPSRELLARKPVLAGVAVVLLGVLVGGAVLFGVVGGESTIVDQVPDEADGVLTVDPAILEDPQTQSVLESGFLASGDERGDMASMRNSFESQTGLDVAAVDAVVAYGRWGPAGTIDRRYGAVIVHADWATEDVVDALASTLAVEYSATQTGDTTVYQPGIEDTTRAPAVAVLDDGEFVIGSILAVEDAAQVENGDADSLSGPVRDSLADAEDGLVTIAATLPSERVAQFEARTGGLTRLESVRAVAVAYDTSADSISLSARLRTNGTEAARDVSDVAAGGVPILASRIDHEPTAEVVRSIEVDREGTDVTLSLDVTVDELRTIAHYLGYGGA